LSGNVFGVTFNVPDSQIHQCSVRETVGGRGNAVIVAVSVGVREGVDAEAAVAVNVAVWVEVGSGVRVAVFVGDGVNVHVAVEVGV